MEKKIDKRLLLFSAVTSFYLILICSKCSPLYPFNDWVDVHCFLTVGRGIKHGMVPYRDLYEQKGPLLYFIVALGTLFSEKSFFPLFVIEIASFTGFIYQSMQIVFVWTKSFSVYIAAPLVFMLITSSEAFSYGFSTEELCLPFLAMALRIVLSKIRMKKNLETIDYISIGICAGVPFWIKYVFSGFFAGLAFVVALWYLRRGSAKEIVRAAVWAITGFMIVTIPILVWYLAKGGIADLFHVYFYNNIMIYSDPHDFTGILIRVMDALFRQNFLWIVCALFGITILVLDIKKNLWEILTIVAGAAMLVFFILLNRFFWTYYVLVLSVFTPLVLIPASLIIGDLKGRAASTYILVVIMMVSIATGCSYILNPNTYLMGCHNDELPQYKFAKTMAAEKQNPTLLNYDFLDGGFYYAAGIMPVNRFFCKFNIDLKEQMTEQNQIIQKGAVDFVVTRDRNSIPGDKYKLKKQEEFYSYPEYFNYYLFERVPE